MQELNGGIMPLDKRYYYIFVAIIYDTILVKSKGLIKAKFNIKKSDISIRLFLVTSNELLVTIILLLFQLLQYV